MTVPVWVEQSNGKFTATVIGAPRVTAEGTTKEQAVGAVTTQLRTHVTSGEVVLVDVEDPGFVGISGLAGKYKDDPTLREICEEAYRLRDAERDAEATSVDRRKGGDGSVLVAGQWIRTTGMDGTVCHVLRPSGLPFPDEAKFRLNGPHSAIRTNQADGVIFLNDQDETGANGPRNCTYLPQKTPIAK